MANNYDAPGDFTLRALDIENFDGSENSSIIFLADSLVIEESIYSSAVMFSVKITDSIGLFTELPIIGGEKITLSYTTAPEFPVITKTFRVYSVVDKMEVSQGSCAYTLKAVSEDFYNDQNQRISRSYTTRTVSDIVTDLLTNQIKSKNNLNIARTINTQSIVIPFLTPFETISWLSSFAIDPDHQGSSFLFFETLDGLNFVSLESLYTQEPLAVYARAYQNLQSSDPQTAADGIKSFSFSKTVDNLDPLNSGLYNSTLRTFDPLTRKYSVNRFSYEEEFDNQKHLEIGASSEIALFQPGKEVSEDSCVRFLITNSAQASSQYILDKGQASFVRTTKLEESLQKRISQINQLDQIQPTLEIAGDSRLRAGGVLMVSLPSFATVSGPTPKEDPLYKGRYLITRVKHMIGGGKYHTTVFLGKDCYSSKPKNYKPAT